MINIKKMARGYLPFKITCLLLIVIHFIVDAKPKLNHHQQYPKLSLDSIFMPQTMPAWSVPNSVSYTFSGSIDDSINYLQFCRATDNTCGNCNVPFTTVINGTPVPYTTSGTTRSIPPTTIAAYLRTNDLVAGTYYVGMYVQSTNSVCSSNTAYCSTNQDSTTAKLCMTAVYDGISVTSLTRNDNGLAPLQTPKVQHGYVGDISGNVYKCDLTALGAFTGCVTTPSGGAIPWESGASALVRFASFNVAGIETQYAYVVDNGVESAAGAIYKCRVESSGMIESGSCASTPTSSPVLPWKPTLFTFATVNGTQYAYVPDNTSPAGNVYKCSLNTIGNFMGATCASTPTIGAPAWVPTNVAFARVGGIQYAYVADGNGSGLIYKCSLNTDGTFVDNSCTSTPVSPPWIQPIALSFATFSGVQYAYVGDINAPNLYRCDIDVLDGALVNCITTPSTPPSWTGPAFTAFALVNGTRFAYVGDFMGSNAYQCGTIASNGTFSSCNTTPTLPGWLYPLGISFAYTSN